MKKLYLIRQTLIINTELNFPTYLASQKDPKFIVIVLLLHLKSNSHEFTC